MMIGKKKSTRGFNPENDGVDHINIHPKAQSALGRLLSFYRNIPFVHPNYGPFYSVEGFSQYLRTGCKHDKLRYVFGFRAKVLGKSYPNAHVLSKAEYEVEILYANYEKIRQNSKLLQMVIDSELPFDSYYCFGPSSIIVDTRESTWLVSGLEEIRKAFKSGTDPEPIKGVIAKYNAEQT